MEGGGLVWRWIGVDVEEWAGGQSPGGNVLVMYNNERVKEEQLQGAEVRYIYQG